MAEADTAWSNYNENEDISDSDEDRRALAFCAAGDISQLTSEVRSASSLQAASDAHKRLPALTGWAFILRLKESDSGYALECQVMRSVLKHSRGALGYASTWRLDYGG